MVCVFYFFRLGCLVRVGGYGVQSVQGGFKRRGPSWQLECVCEWVGGSKKGVGDYVQEKEARKKRQKVARICLKSGGVRVWGTVQEKRRREKRKTERESKGEEIDGVACGQTSHPITNKKGSVH